MPGIFGLIQKKISSKEKTELLMNKMTALLCHQPWYRSKLFVSDDVGFGSISVNNLLGPKKINYGSKEYIVLIDGYIYSINDTDATTFSQSSEKILQKITELFVDRGVDILPKIEGNYSVAIYNIYDHELIIFNDIIGPRRLYYADLPEVFVFASEVKAISFLPIFKKLLDWKGISDFLNYGYVLGGNTFFKAVKFLSSASLVSYKKRENILAINKYWKPDYTEKQGDIDDFADEATFLLYNSIHEKLKPRSSVICPISGGLDSRIILGTLKNIEKDVTIKPVTYGQSFSHEYTIAKKVCKALDINDHSLVEINPTTLQDKSAQAVWLSEGMTSMANSHLLLLPSALGLNYDYAFNGIYGGPTNYDAPYYTQHHIDADLSIEEKTKDIESVISLNFKPYENIFNNHSLRHITQHSFSSIFEELKNHLDVSDRFCNQRDAFFIENRMRRMLCQSSFYRFYWEEQLPLSNYSLYDFYLSTPPDMKLGRKLLKTILIRSFPLLAKISDANTGLDLFQRPTYWYRKKKKMELYLKYYLPRLTAGHIVLYDKTGYAHYSRWFLRDKKSHSFYYNKMFSDSIQDSEIFDLSKLNDFFKNIRRTTLGYFHLERLTTFSIWYNLFVVENGVNEVKDKIKLATF